MAILARVANGMVCEAARHYGLLYNQHMRLNQTEIGRSGACIAAALKLQAAIQPAC
jgi:hypothetical protein